MPASVSFTLSVRNGRQAVDFYKAAFGAMEVMRAESPDGDVVVQLEIGTHRFFVADESPANDNYSPESLGNRSTVRMALIVEDPDAAAAQAIGAGGRQVYAVADQPYGWRLGRIVDPFGHHWEIGRPCTSIRERGS